MSGFQGNMEQLDAVADWETHTQWEGQYAPRTKPRIGDPNTSHIHLQGNGRYRVKYTSRDGQHGLMHAYDSYEEAKSAALVLERDCGYRLVG